MREIKFRAWDDIAKCYRGHTDPLTIKMLVFREELDRGALEQYIGLKDEKGNESYEGDIIIDMFEKTTHAIIFVNGAFCIKDGYGVPELFEVIGNIHENPEILGTFCTRHIGGKGE